MKKRQDQILLFLYTFRFLTRNQIQLLLHQKHFKRIIIWLNELTQSGFIRRYYNPKTVTVPAVYSLGNKARKYLKDNPDFKEIKASLLDRIWREHTLSLQFRKHCLFIADIYISLQSLVETTSATLNFYPKSKLHGMDYLIRPNPDAYFSIEEKNKNIKRYCLDVFDELPARMVLRKRVRQYFEYYESNYWQDHTKKPFPVIILISPDDRFKNYINRVIQNMLEDEPDLSLSDFLSGAALVILPVPETRNCWIDLKKPFSIRPLV